jgi:hypothetical protein
MAEKKKAGDGGKAANGKAHPRSPGRPRKQDKKLIVGCQREVRCNCPCTPCSAGTIALVVCNVSVDVTLSDMANIEHGRIIRIQPEHQIRFFNLKAADELKRLLELEEQTE